MTQNGTDTIKLKVWGDYACFTRPEMKVERLSYEVMTPSAARNILQAILWKPAIEWQIVEILVLKPIRWVSIRRNELASVISTVKVSQAIKGTEQDLGIFIEEDRQQRAGLFLRDVEYVITAKFDLTNKAGDRDNYLKFRESFCRRASRGQCFTQPYLGCREFACFFELLQESENEPQPINESKPLGWMLFDIDYKNNSPAPMFFQAALENGKLRIPAPTSGEVRK